MNAAGRLGRMFPELPAHVTTDAALQALARTLKDTQAKHSADNLSIPGGYTYLGQFIEHDISHNPDSQRAALSLNCLYGGGPERSPYLYARNVAQSHTPGPKFLIGATAESFQNFGAVRAGLPNDLPRNTQGVALIGDARNDCNLLVAQTHLALLKFHNKIVELLIQANTAPEELFAKARRLATWHYQWIVLHDFVERLAGRDIVERMLLQGRRHYSFSQQPYLPAEFALAANRCGCSMVRETYSHNRIFSAQGAPPVAAALHLLFTFCGASGGILGDLAPDPLTGPAPVCCLSSNWVIDWRRYYDFNTPAQAHAVLNHSRKIDPFLTPSLDELPGGAGNLALLILRTSLNCGLPSGQAIAAALGIDDALMPMEIETGVDGRVAKEHGLHLSTPLWYYLLKEAQVRSGGARLGPVGAQIFADVFVGLVQSDPTSYLFSTKDWKPTLPARTPGTFTMMDLLQFVADISPIDGIRRVDTW